MNDLTTARLLMIAMLRRRAAAQRCPLSQLSRYKWTGSYRPAIQTRIADIGYAPMPAPQRLFARSNRTGRF
jgi:hypothetical protein